ncbi:MAG TPA: alpha/beta hydrolase [Actinomycetota bacterium]|nr:alpha/beta hydrolase [Actinomycetota bacterium]
MIGDADGGALAAMFAATYPGRTLGLVLWTGGVRMAQAPDYPWGMPEDQFEQRLRQRMELWGDASKGTETAAMTFSAAGNRLAEDPAFVDWLLRLQRYGAAPGDVATFSRVWFSTDARSALPAIQVPSVVMVREGWPAGRIEESEWTADQIAGARLERLPGDEDDPYIGDVVGTAGAIRRFAEAIKEEHAAFDRVLATVLFTGCIAPHPDDRRSVARSLDARRQAL